MFWIGFIAGAVSMLCTVTVWALVILGHDVADHERNQP